MIGLAPGAVLTFIKDPSVTCEVVSNRKVRFEGQDLFLSKAALIAVRKMGYDWPSVRGWDYWLHHGKKLSEIASQIVEQEDEA